MTRTAAEIYVDELQVGVEDTRASCGTGSTWRCVRSGGLGVKPDDMHPRGRAAKGSGCGFRAEGWML